MYALINYLGSICDFFSLLLVFSDPADFDVLEQFGTNKGVSIKSFLFCKGESIKSYFFLKEYQKLFFLIFDLSVVIMFSILLVTLILISEFNNKVIHIV